jgi:hypothetical protein
MLDMSDQKYILQLQMLDIFLMLDQDEKIYQKRKMILIGNILIESQEDG